MIHLGLTGHHRAALLLNALHVLKWVEIFLLVGKIQARYCKCLILLQGFCISLARIIPFSYLYILYLAVDANFKLKGKDRKLQDVELMPGQGFFVEESAYQQHIQNYVNQPEVLLSCLHFYHSVDILSVDQHLSI